MSKVMSEVMLRGSEEVYQKADDFFKSLAKEKPSYLIVSLGIEKELGVIPYKEALEATRKELAKTEEARLYMRTKMFGAVLVDLDSD